MNIYLEKPLFAPVLGLFTAKCSVFWCKTRGKMVLNAVHFGAKRSVFWCKTQGKMVLNAVQNGAIRESIRINIPYNGIIKTF